MHYLVLNCCFRIRCPRLAHPGKVSPQIEPVIFSAVRHLLLQGIADISLTLWGECRKPGGLKTKGALPKARALNSASWVLTFSVI